MNYIIDPMLFYCLSICNALKTVTGIMAGFLMVGVGVAIGCYIYNQCQVVAFEHQRYKECIEEHSKYKVICKKYIYLSFILFIIFLLLAIFIPNKSTCLEMIISKNITLETVEGGIEALKSTVDYIVEKLQTLR